LFRVVFQLINIYFLSSLALNKQIDINKSPPPVNHLISQFRPTPHNPI